MNTADLSAATCKAESVGTTATAEFSPGGGAVLETNGQLFLSMYRNAPRRVIVRSAERDLYQLS